MIKVSLEGISKAYEAGKPVLQSIDLDIAGGDLFFLLGPSGCGKSTLLRLIAGFLEPDRGAILFGETEITHLAPEKRETAMVFQNYALWPHMTVRENVEFGLKVRKLKSDELKRQAADALDLVGLSDLAERKIPSLSGGQQQRVALARAIVVRPKVLLLDEPLSNLDAKLRETMRSEIRRICKEAELTTIYVTHDQKEALAMADCIAVLDRGEIQQVGSPRDLYSRPTNRFVAEFIGTGNFIEGKVLNRKGDAAEVETSLGILQSESVTENIHAGGRVTVLLRPEAFAFVEDGEQNTFAATLSHGAFLGEMGQWTAKAGDTQLQVFEMRPPQRSGSDVRLQVQPRDVILLCED